MFPSIDCSKIDVFLEENVFFENIYCGYNDLIIAKSPSNQSLYALNYKTGVLKWKIAFNKEFLDFVEIFKNLIVFSSRDKGLSSLFALDCSNGDIIWKFAFNKSEKEFKIIDALIFRNKNILCIITTTDNPNNWRNFVYSFDVLTGDLKYREELPPWRIVGKSFSYEDLIILRTRDGYNMVISTLSGEIKWLNTDLGSICSYPAEVNGILYGTGGFIGMNEIYAVDPQKGKTIEKIDGPWEKENNGLIIDNKLIFCYQRPHLNVYDLITQNKKKSIEFSNDYLYLRDIDNIRNYILLLFRKTYRENKNKDSIVCINRETLEELWEYSPYEGEVECIKFSEENNFHLFVAWKSKVFSSQENKVLEEYKLIVFDVGTGKHLWEKPYSKAKSSFNCPFQLREMLYIINSNGDLIALNSKNGKVIWSISSLKDGKE